MPDISIVKFKVRRGSDEERARVILEQGELGYTVDTKRLFVGDGLLSGGYVAGSKVHDFLSTNDTRNNITNAYKNDIVFENNWIYQLTGTDYSDLDHWKLIAGGIADNNTLDYNGDRELQVADQGVGSDQLADDAVIASKFHLASAVYVSGGIVVNSTYGLSANVDDVTLTTHDNIFKVKDDGIYTDQLSADAVTEDVIASSALGAGLSGGSGEILTAKIDNTSIVFNDSDQLTVGEVDASNIAVGPGISTDDGRLTHFIEDVNTTEFTVDGQATLNFAQRLNESVTHFLPRLEVDNKGLVTSSENGNVLALSANHSTYGGFYGQLSGQESSTRVTTVTATTATNVQELSSAGFMVLRLGAPSTEDDAQILAQGGGAEGYYAVPIFAIPDELVTLIENQATIEVYGFEWGAYRAYDPTSNDYELNGQILSAAACSGVWDYTGYAEEVLVYTAVQEPDIGDVFAIDSNTLSAGALSGWIGIDIKSKVYNVDQSSVIQAISTCGDLYPISLSAYRAYDPASNDYEAGIATLSAAACSGADSYYNPTDLIVVYTQDTILSVGDYIAASTTELQTVDTPSLSGWINLVSTDPEVYLVDGNNQIAAVSACSES